MDNWKVARGSTAQFTVTVRDGSGNAIAYAGSEALAGAVWAGDDQAALFAPETAWDDAAAGTLTVTVAGADTRALTVGTYRVAVTVDGLDAFYATLEVGHAPGSAAALPVYCTYEEMLRHAPWIAQVQDLDNDQAGFAEQRAQARRDIDDVICSSYRGCSVGLFGSQSLAAMAWGGGGPYRTTMPSETIRGYLTAGHLMRGTDPTQPAYRPKVAKMAAYRAISIVGLKQLGINKEHAALGAMFYRWYLAEMSSFTAELDVNADGLCEIPIPCGVTNTLFT